MFIQGQQPPTAESYSMVNHQRSRYRQSPVLDDSICLPFGFRSSHLNQQEHRTLILERIARNRKGIDNIDQKRELKLKEIAQLHEYEERSNTLISDLKRLLVYEKNIKLTLETQLGFFDHHMDFFDHFNPTTQSHLELNSCINTTSHLIASRKTSLSGDILSCENRIYALEDNLAEVESVADSIRVQVKDGSELLVVWERGKNELSDIIREQLGKYFSLRLIPEHVWRQIFHYCVTGDHEERKGLRQSMPTRIPLILSAVCQEWREIAHNQSSLWRLLLIPFVPYISRNHLSCLQHYISLAGMKELVVHSYGQIEEHVRPTEPVKISRVLERVVDITRLDLRFDASKEDACKTAFRILNRCSATLHTVCFENLSLGHVDTTWATSKYAIRSLILTNISINVDLPAEMDRSAISADRLELRISRRVNAESISSMLERIPTISKLVITLSKDWAISQQGLKKIKLPQLMGISAPFAVLGSAFMARVDMPLLSRIQIRIPEGGNSDKVLMNWKAFLRVGSRRLQITHVDIRVTPRATEGDSRLLVKILDELPHLTHISLDEGAILPALAAIGDLRKRREIRSLTLRNSLVTNLEVFNTIRQWPPEGPGYPSTVTFGDLIVENCPNMRKSKKDLLEEFTVFM